MMKTKMKNMSQRPWKRKMMDIKKRKMMNIKNRNI